MLSKPFTTKAQKLKAFLSQVFFLQIKGNIVLVRTCIIHIAAASPGLYQGKKNVNSPLFVNIRIKELAVYTVQIDFFKIGMLINGNSDLVSKCVENSNHSLFSQ